MATAKPNYLSMKKAFESAVTSRKLDPKDLTGGFSQPDNRTASQQTLQELREEVREAFKDKKVRENFSFLELARTCFGDHTANTWCRDRAVSLDRAREAAGAVSSEIFADISAQWMYSNLYDGYVNEEEFVFTRIIGDRKATNTKGEIVPCYTDVLNLPLPFRTERQSFDELEFVDDWIKTPPTLDRGGLLSITEEAIYDDKVGDLAARDKSLGYAMGVTREIDAINAFIDENSSTGGGTVIPYPTGQSPWRYNHKSDTPNTTAGIQTYAANSGNHTWDNLVSGAASALTDWTSLNLAQQKFYAMLNPFTGLPINVKARHLVVPKTLLPTAERIARATSVRTVTPGYATSGGPVQTIGATPVDVNYEIVSTRLLQQRMSNAAAAATASWYLADISRTVNCMMVFPLEIVEAPPLNEDHFRRRIVKRWRVSQDYAYVVWQPRNSVKSAGS